MNIEELLDSFELKQDEWSLTSPKFGKEGQLTVVGWSGKRKGREKFYILKCNVCSEDRELFKGGYFKSIKGSLTKGWVPCGCSKAPKWSKEQYVILCHRAAKEIGHKFLGFNGEFKGSYTKIIMICTGHGEWNSGNVSALINRGIGCPSCMIENSSVVNSKPDEVMIASFFASGAFHPDTKFWRSDRLTKQGFRVYWCMFCPDCADTGEAVCSSLQLGTRSCGCSKNRQQEAYINWVLDGDYAMAIKFGIARDSKYRVKKQNQKSVYDVQQHAVYKFPTVNSCKKAERECKQELECGVLPKQEFPDGWTETTWVYNLDKIIEIYERNGGLEIAI